MNRHIHIGIAMLVVGFAASGCVSNSTFEKMQADKNSEIASLEQEKASLEQEKSSLEDLKATLEKQRAALEEEKAALEQKNMASQQQVGSLQQEKDALLAASQQRQQQYDALVKTLSSEVQKGQLQVKQYQNMLSVDLAEQIFFDSGRATLKPAGKKILKKVGDALKGYENKVIRVVGHTDNVPIAKSLQDKFPSNWELSVARATTVVRFLQDTGVPPERMVASGRGEYDPVASNDTEEGRQKNRRIEIMLIDKSLSDEIEKSIK